jgi:hypothetical protein
MTTVAAKPRRATVLAEPLEQRRLLSGSYSFQPLASFAPATGTNAWSPVGQLAMDASANIYGITNAGGANHGGAVFEVQPGNHTPILLGSFANPGVSLTPGGLVLNKTTGMLFGITAIGGNNAGDGTLWELPTTGGTITTVANFNASTTGSAPGGNIIIDSAGNIFGTALNGGANNGGTVWELPVNTTTIIALAPFARVGTGGSTAVAGANGIGIDPSGNLFGTTSGSTLAGTYGTVWELPKALSSPLQTLATFLQFNGNDPVGGVVVDANDNVFGVTEFGGNNLNNGAFPPGYGTVWKVGAGTGHVTVLANFNNNPDGQHPVGGLGMDSAGNLFGTTSSGGLVSGSSQGYGTTWELPADGSALRTLVPFNVTDGAVPFGAVLVDQTTGNVFGTTGGGGANQDGTVFELANNGAAGVGSAALSATVARTSLPNAVVAGTGRRGVATVSVSNPSASVVKGSFTIELFASSDGAIDSTATPIGSRSGTLVVPANRTIPLAVPIIPLPAGLNGNYTILAQVMDTSGNVTNANSGPTVLVAAPFITLSESITRLILPVPTVSGTSVRGSAIMRVTNSGNNASIGPVQFALFASPDGTVANGTPFTPVSRTLRIPSMGSALVVVPITTIPSTLNGNYSIVAQVTDPKGSLTTSAATAAVTIAPPTLTLAATFNFIRPITLSTARSTQGVFSVTIANTGNISVGSLTNPNAFSISLGLVSQDGTVNVPLQSFSRALLFTPQARRTLAFAFTASALSSITAGSYLPTVTVTVPGSSYSVSSTGQVPVTVG